LPGFAGIDEITWRFLIFPEAPVIEGFDLFVDDDGEITEA
jgi:hypothetical protein